MGGRIPGWQLNQRIQQLRGDLDLPVVRAAGAWH
jgi:hypothetical protein